MRRLRLCDYYSIKQETELPDGLQVQGELYPRKWNERPVYVWAFFPTQSGPRGSWYGYRIDAPGRDDPGHGSEKDARVSEPS